MIKPDVQVFLHMLSNCVPFGFARFNDGEMSAIRTTAKHISRGYQKVSETLTIALTEALEYRQENYWKGMPCSTCFPDHYEVAKKIVGDYPYLTQATVFTNRHHKEFMSDFPASLEGRSLAIVHGESHDIYKLNEQLKLSFHSIPVPDMNSWDANQEVLPRHFEFHDGTVVLLSCGPLSRILVRAWFEIRPDCTFIDTGSLFDPWVRGVSYKYHQGKTKPCEECN
jgi:hypothetical protein